MTAKQNNIIDLDQARGQMAQGPEFNATVASTDKSYMGKMHEQDGIEEMAHELQSGWAEWNPVIDVWASLPISENGHFAVIVTPTTGPEDQRLPRLVFFEPKMEEQTALQLKAALGAVSMKTGFKGLDGLHFLAQVFLFFSELALIANEEKSLFESWPGIDIETYLEQAAPILKGEMPTEAWAFYPFSELMWRWTQAAPLLDSLAGSGWKKPDEWRLPPGWLLSSEFDMDNLKDPSENQDFEWVEVFKNGESVFRADRNFVNVTVNAEKITLAPNGSQLVKALFFMWMRGQTPASHGCIKERVEIPQTSRLLDQLKLKERELLIQSAKAGRLWDLNIGHPTNCKIQFS